MDPMNNNNDDTLGSSGPKEKKPNESLGKSKQRTALQKHVDFWDENGDGAITPLDTYRGFRRLGFNIFVCIFAAVFLNFSLAYVTQKSWVPFFGNPLFKIYTDKIHRCKHGSDSESYDAEGNLVSVNLEKIFSKYDKDNKGGLNSRDLVNLVCRDRNVFDLAGWTAAVVEWGAIYALCADKNGLVKKEDIMSQYDGTLFYRIAKEQEERKKHQSGEIHKKFQKEI